MPATQIIKQMCHQFIFTLLFQYTTYTAVIFTYFYHIISILHFQYTRSLLPNYNLLLYLAFLCSNCRTFSTVKTNNIWRDRVTSIKTQTVSQIQQKHPPFKTKTASLFCVYWLLKNRAPKVIFTFNF
jgi:hypothetical protein